MIISIKLNTSTIGRANQIALPPNKNGRIMINKTIRIKFLIVEINIDVKEWLIDVKYEVYTWL